VNSVSTQSDGSGAMFDRIAARYDLMNRLISFGMDGRWRRALVQALELDGQHAPHALDVATGTADIAISIANSHPGCRVTGLDPSAGMLEVGRDKLVADLDERVTLVEGDAQAMPFDDDTFDASCISFGIRNVPDRELGLREMARVTRSGGRVVVLELGEPQTGVMAPFARFHIHQVVPRIGALIAGDSAYRYLEKSIAAFPPPDAFAAMLESAGLRFEQHVSYCFGAANLFISRVVQ
jgi:demethylmenaquinone methyltransferase/2-methoxy-6-polyprenyl-1,4-benzoquinol methylase